MEVGDRIKGGRWLLDAKLATGGCSVVFAASHRNGSRAAIKVLDSEFTEDEDMRRRFRGEGYAANKVGHEGAVRILDDDTTEDGRPYLVMELLEGEPLDRRRERLGGKLALAEALTIADELLDVLAAAHSHGIIHRDIKPANVFLTTKGHVKVLDFGFAKVKEAAQTESTAVGTLLGTPGFLPPERARGLREEVDARSDIWSVGATLFTLISGEYVHEGPNPIALLAATAQRPVRSLETVAPGVPRALVDIIDKALAFEKADRWPSAREMQNAVRDVMLHEDVTEVGLMAPGAESAAASGGGSAAASVGASAAASGAAPQRVKSSLATTTEEDDARPQRVKNPLATTIEERDARPRRVKNPLATTIEERDAPLPRLYDEADELSSKGRTELLPATQMLGPRPTSNENATQLLVTTTPSSQHAAPVAPPRAKPAVGAVIKRPRTRPAPPRHGVLAIVIGALLALIGLLLGFAALFGLSP